MTTTNETYNMTAEDFLFSHATLQDAWDISTQTIDEAVLVIEAHITDEKCFIITTDLKSALLEHAASLVECYDDAILAYLPSLLEECAISQSQFDDYMSVQ